MRITTEVFGIKSEDLDAVTEEVAAALRTEANLRYGEAKGGDYSSFRPASGGSLILQDNFNGIEQEWEQKNYKEFGLIILVQQSGSYFDYEPNLTSMPRFPATLLYRNRYDSETEKDEDLFVLKHERAKSGEGAGPA